MSEMNDLIGDTAQRRKWRLNGDMVSTDDNGIVRMMHVVDKEGIGHGHRECEWRWRTGVLAAGLFTWFN